jgi:hypothetical protein
VRWRSQLWGRVLMESAVDLNPRQSARTLDQAVRYHATALLQPADWPDADGLKGRLAALTQDTVRIEITEPPMLSLDTVVGTYCDVTLQLGHDRFLFSTHATRAERVGGSWYLELARPDKIQVCQRRRFWRVKLADSSQVQLRRAETGDADTLTGWLCNISGEGLACLVEVDAAERLLIGETVLAAFELPSCDEPFDLGAILCNKTPTARQDKVILGMQFLEPASTGATGPAQRLNEFLLQRYGSGVAPVGGDVRVADGALS